MDKCLYNGKIISAEDFAKSFESETKLRKAAKTLICCDPECHSELIYRQGPKRAAHFSHKSSSTVCCYSEYFRMNSGIYRQIQSDILGQMREIASASGHTVDFDVRVSKSFRHITNVTLCGKRKFAIDIMKSNKRVGELEKLSEGYRDTDYIPFPIIIDDIYGHFNDQKETYYTVRYWLRTSPLHTILIYNQKQNKYLISRLSSVDTVENGTMYDSLNVFALGCNIEELTINDNGIQTAGFEEAFDNWENQRKNGRTAYAAMSETTVDIKPRSQETSGPKDRKAKRCQEDEQQKKKALYEKGVYIERNEEGSVVEVKIEDISVHRCERYLVECTSEEIKDKIASAFSGSIRAVRELINILRKPQGDEMKTFIIVCKEFSTAEPTSENSIKARILRQIKLQIRPD